MRHLRASRSRNQPCPPGPSRIIGYSSEPRYSGSPCGSRPALNRYDSATSHLNPPSLPPRSSNSCLCTPPAPSPKHPPGDYLESHLLRGTRCSTTRSSRTPMEEARGMGEAKGLPLARRFGHRASTSRTRSLTRLLRSEGPDPYPRAGVGRAGWGPDPGPRASLAGVGGEANAPRAPRPLHRGAAGTGSGRRSTRLQSAHGVLDDVALRMACLTKQETSPHAAGEQDSSRFQKCPQARRPSSFDSVRGHPTSPSFCFPGGLLTLALWLINRTAKERSHRPTEARANEPTPVPDPG